MYRAQRTTKTQAKKPYMPKPKVNYDLKQVIPGVYVNIGNDFVEFSNCRRVIHDNKQYYKYSYSKLLKGLTPLANNKTKLHEKVCSILEKVYYNSLIQSIAGTAMYKQLSDKIWNILLDVCETLEREDGEDGDAD